MSLESAVLVVIAVVAVLLVAFLAVAALLDKQNCRFQAVLEQERDAGQMRDRQREAETEAIRQHLQYEREQEEERQREAAAGEMARIRAESRQIINAAQTAAAKMQAPVVTGKDLQAVDDSLREFLMMGLAHSPIITVKYLATPAGRVGIQWSVHQDSACALKVSVYRDDKLVFVDYSSENRLGHQLVPGRRYVYRFTVSDGSRVMENDLRFEVMVPTAKQWNRAADRSPKKASAADAKEERKRKAREALEGLSEMEAFFDEMRRAYGKDLAAKELDPDDVQFQMAAFEALIARLRDQQA